MTFNKTILDRLEIFQQSKVQCQLFKITQTRTRLAEKSKMISSERAKFLEVLVKFSNADKQGKVTRVLSDKIIIGDILSYAKKYQDKSEELLKVEIQNAQLINEYNQAKAIYDKVQEIRIPFLFREKILKEENESIEASVLSKFYVNSWFADGHDFKTSYPKTYSSVPIQGQIDDSVCRFTANLPGAGRFTVNLSESDTQLNVLINGDGYQEKRHASNSKKKITDKLKCIKRNVLVQVNPHEDGV